MSTEAWATWRDVISEQQQSGKSAAVFCQGRGLRVWQICNSTVHRERSRTMRSMETVNVFLPGGRVVLALPRKTCGDTRLPFTGNILTVQETVPKPKAKMPLHVVSLHLLSCPSDPTLLRVASKWKLGTGCTSSSSQGDAL
jgi:hypothetical protein